MKNKCVPDGLYYNGQVDRYYYIKNLKNGGIKVRTFFYNKYYGVYRILNTKTINSGNVFFNSGLLVQNNLNSYLLELDNLQPKIRQKILTLIRYRETYG